MFFIDWQIVFWLLVYIGLCIPAVWNGIVLSRMIKRARVASKLSDKKHKFHWTAFNVILYGILLLFLPFFGLYHWLVKFDKIKENNFKVMLYAIVKDLQKAENSPEDKEQNIRFLAELFYQYFGNNDGARFQTIMLSGIITLDEAVLLTKLITEYNIKYQIDPFKKTTTTGEQNNNV